MNTQEKYLVTGASGQLGQQVLNELLKQGVTSIIATTRTPEKLAQYVEAGVSVRYADFNQAHTLPSAFDGATRMLLISTDQIGSRVEQHRNAIEAAVQVGVQHILYTSSHEPEDSIAIVAQEHAPTEALIRESGIAYTILRNNLYAEMVLMALQPAIQAGSLMGATQGTPAAYISRLDCAQAAATAMTKAQNQNQIYNITGPKAYNYQEIAQIVTELNGQLLKYQELAHEDYQQVLVKSGMPEDYVRFILNFEQVIQRGEQSSVSSAMQELTGSPGLDLKDFLKQQLLVAV